MRFNLEDYEEVKDRIPRFLERFPDGRIVTQIIHPTNGDGFGTVVFVAELFKDMAEQHQHCPLATGWALESEGSSPVNKTSHLENCETSAIGRALANLGIQGKLRPSREEMAKVQRAEVERPVARLQDKQIEAKRKAYFANMRNHGMEGDEAKAYVKDMFKLESFNDATVEQLRDAYKAAVKASEISL